MSELLNSGKIGNISNGFYLKLKGGVKKATLEERILYVEQFYLIHKDNNQTIITSSLSSLIQLKIKKILQDHC